MFRYGKGPTWDGSTLDINSATNNAWVIHELAHFLTTKNKELPNWGMGTDPGGGRSKKTLDTATCSADEDKALLGGVILLENFGLDVEEVREHINHYNINSIEPEILLVTYRALPAFMKKLCSLDRLKQLIFL